MEDGCTDGHTHWMNAKGRSRDETRSLWHWSIQPSEYWQSPRRLHALCAGRAGYGEGICVARVPKRPSVVASRIDMVATMIRNMLRWWLSMLV